MNKIIFTLYIAGIVFGIFISPIFIAIFTSMMFIVCFIYFVKLTWKPTFSPVIKQYHEPMWLYCVFISSFIIPIGFIFLWLRVKHTIFSPLSVQIVAYTLITKSFWLLLHSVKLLGKAYRQTPSLVQGQPIITKGPYSLVRHPIYFSYVMLFSGTFMLFNILAGIIGGCCVFFWAFHRSKIEEKLLIEELTGSIYQEYKNNTPMIFPTMKSIVRFIKSYIANKN